jgi:hypothetical protein
MHPLPTDPSSGQGSVSVTFPLGLTGATLVKKLERLRWVFRNLQEMSMEKSEVAEHVHVESHRVCSNCARLL